MTSGIYLYLAILVVVFIFLGFKLLNKKRSQKKDYEEREDNVFYDAVKEIKRD